MTTALGAAGGEAFLKELYIRVQCALDESESILIKYCLDVLVMEYFFTLNNKCRIIVAAAARWLADLRLLLKLKLNNA